MELPVIPFKIPEIALPFDIPVLMHPPVDHLVIALPLVVLLLEVVNLIVKKRAVGMTSFFLLLLTIVAAIAAYYTGSADGKEAFDALSQAGQVHLKAHKLMGTYLMFASVAVLVFKLLSVMIKRGLMKGLYFLLLILFVAGILKQGKEGGELVYHYGANVARVADMDSEISDLKEELDDLKSAAKEKEAPTLEEKVSTAETSTAEKTSGMSPVEKKAEAPAAKVEPQKEVSEAMKTEDVSVAAQSDVSAVKESLPEAPSEEKITVEKKEAETNAP